MSNCKVVFVAVCCKVVVLHGGEDSNYIQ